MSPSTISLRSNSARSSPTKKVAGLPARTLFRGNGSPLAGTSSGGLGLNKIIFAITSVSLLAIIVTIQKSMYNNDPTADIFSNDPKYQLSPMAKAVQNTPMGSLGPSGTKRKHFRYYDSLFHTVLQYGADATSIIEVGCASDPFLKYLDWIDRRTCVAPYFVSYGKKLIKNSTSIERVTADFSIADFSIYPQSIERVTADFMKYELPKNKKYDLLLCSQVLEHVPDPASFMKKLISTATTSIMSVPYEWDDCGKSCGHVTDHISYEMILEWSSPHVPIYSGIVTERYDEKRKGKDNTQRIILVYKTE